jgi:hypothetical protein
MAYTHALIYIAILTQIFLTMVVYITLAVAKSRAAKRGEVDRQRAALYADAWPDSVQKINNNIRNQFEVPVLFYVLCFVLIGIGAAGTLVAALAWLFVATRIAHAWIHTRSNYVPARRAVFMAGVAIVLCLLLIALWQLHWG